MNDLPELHPGTPPGMKVDVNLIIRRKTAKAVLVQRPYAEATRSAWLPLSLITMSEDYRAGSILRSEVPEGQQCWFDVFSVTMPVWLYNKIRPQLCEPEPAR